jgi:hypothetical protein
MRGLIICALASLALVGCDEPTPQEVAAREGQHRAQAAINNSAANSEQDNIERRIRLTSQPGLLGYIVLLNETGQPILYTSIKGKVTSSGKRLTRPYNAGGNPSPSDEGAWGSSDPYIYFWTSDDQYMQWNGNYLYSNSPIRLATEPLVVSIGAPAQPEPSS